MFTDAGFAEPGQFQASNLNPNSQGYPDSPDRKPLFQVLYTRIPIRQINNINMKRRTNESDSYAR
jgi:hypothetical protein